MCRPSSIAAGLLAWTSSALAATPTTGQLEHFESKVRPVLVRSCYECHSTAEKKAKGGLLVDTRAALLRGGDSGPAIVPGKPEDSLLIKAVRHAEEDLKMPKKRLGQHEIDALADWIRDGAPDPRDGEDAAPVETARFDWEKERQHWAFRPIQSSAPPAVADPAWPRTELDHFVAARREKAGLRPAGDADARTLLRRVHYVLTGLPPSPEEAAAFVAGHARDAQGAMTALIDRLLASPQYGERWGRHWMDLVRYADTAGDNSDYPIPQLWRYRNWIINSLNADKPYDVFLREQMAGDLLPAKDQAERNDRIIATGYLALSRRFGSVVDRYPHHLTIEDTLDNLGKTMLGLSLSCARCHDHKFDAIGQRDYYALYGMFASTRYAFPGIELLKVQKDFVPLLSAEEMEQALAPFRDRERELQKRHDELARQRKALEAKKAELETLIASDTGEQKAQREHEAATLQQEVEKVRGQIRGAAGEVEKHQRTRPQIPDAYAVQDGKPADAAIMLKGEPDRTGEKVPRRWLEVLGGQRLPEAVAAQSSGRAELAGWVTDPANPLTARVIVNRVWYYHFGRGLVSTPNDFGVRGTPPSHPELLDWLASRFMAEGWSLKKLHRIILASRTWQLSSEEDATALAADPNNVLLWRAGRRRLDAETLRDTLLHLSATLDPTPLAEAHPFPPPDKWDFTQHHPFKATYDSKRRSVYLMGARLNALPFFQTFDGPDRNASSPARDSSVTSVQALYFLNDKTFHDAAEAFAARLLAESNLDEPARLDRAFALAVLRAPTESERANLQTFLSTAREKLASSAGDAAERRLWASLARALFRTNEFLYID